MSSAAATSCRQLSLSRCASCRQFRSRWPLHRLTQLGSAPNKDLLSKPTDRIKSSERDTPAQLPADMTTRLQPSPRGHGHTALRRAGVPVGLAAAGHTHMTPPCRGPAGAVLCAQPSRGQPRVGPVPAAGRQPLPHPGHIHPGSKPPVALVPGSPRQWCAPTVRDRPGLERAGVLPAAARHGHTRACAPPTPMME